MEKSRINKPNLNRKINLTKNKREVEAEIFFSNKQALKKAKDKNNLFYKNTFLSVTVNQDKSNNKQNMKKNYNMVIEEEESEDSESDFVSEKEYSNFIKEYKQFIKAKNKNSFKSKVT